MEIGKKLLDVYIDPCDIQQELPVCRCPACGGEVYAGETMFDLDGFVCVDCYRDGVHRLSDQDPVLLAAEMGVQTKEV